MKQRDANRMFNEQRFSKKKAQKKRIGEKMSFRTAHSRRKAS